MSREQLREEIRQNIQEAQAAAKQAAEEARQAADQASGEGRSIIITPPLPPLAPGQTVVRRYPEETIPPQAENIAIAFFIMIAAIIIGLPIMRAIGRRIERGTPAPAVPREVQEQLQHLTQSVDAIAIEVERISEGQRFTTRMLAERTGESARPADGK